MLRSHSRTENISVSGSKFHLFDDGNYLREAIVLDSATPVVTSAAASATPPASVVATAPSAAPSASVAKAPAKCKGLMLQKRCAEECSSDDDCPDPKERCDTFNGFDDDGQNVMGAMVCQYDADNTPRAAKPTAGAPLVGSDCPKGWLASVSEANKCDKECKADAECGAGNVCKAVGPIGVGKQCQKK